MEPKASKIANSIDAWAIRFFSSMLAQALTIEEFESVVDYYWKSGHFLVQAPETLEYFMRLVASQADIDAHYGSELPFLNFKSTWLVGVHGKPGAIHIQAPPEKSFAPRQLGDLNRVPHEHDSGRIALVTKGSAVFHVVRNLPNGERTMLDCPVTTGDLLFWPAWTPHTFDACEGFSLVSVMANYVSPAEDGFAFPVTDENLDQLNRMEYVDFKNIS